MERDPAAALSAGHGHHRVHVHREQPVLPARSRCRAAGRTGRQAVALMPATITREQLVTSILDFLSHQDLLSLAHIRAALEREIDGAGSTALVELKRQLTADDGWNYYPPSRLVAHIHNL